MTSVFMFVRIYRLFLHPQQQNMAHLKSCESQFRFLCPDFCSINSNCALRYLICIFPLPACMHSTLRLLHTEYESMKSIKHKLNTYEWWYRYSDI